jgi:hypothetical protein
MTEPVKTLTIDGVEHEVSKFSEAVQNLVIIHSQWSTDLVKERMNVAKTEAALRGLDAELSKLVSEELAPKADEDVTDVEVK